MIEVDGRSIQSYDLDSLRRHIGMVLHNILFQGSVLDNLRAVYPKLMTLRSSGQLKI